MTSMATAKKPTKKAAASRAPAKTKKTSVKRVAKVPSQKEPKSFRVAAQKEPFFVFRITKQTAYWTVLAAVVLALGLWVIDINDRVQHTYDNIDTINQRNANFLFPDKKQ